MRPNSEHQVAHVFTILRTSTQHTHTYIHINTQFIHKAFCGTGQQLSQPQCIYGSKSSHGKCPGPHRCLSVSCIVITQLNYLSVCRIQLPEQIPVLGILGCACAQGVELDRGLRSQHGIHTPPARGHPPLVSEDLRRPILLPCVGGTARSC